jgi:bacterioferritin (cytochrome b1)
MDDATLSPPVGASVWDREMFSYLTEHTRREGQMLEEYVRTAATTDSKALAYLLDMLVQDEHRHHQFFRDLAASLKAEAEFDVAGPVVPRLDLDVIDRDDLLDVTQRLLENERDDLAELKRLHKELRDFKDTTLWDLLVEIMQRDTEKHIAILQFVAKHARAKR